MYVPLRQKIPAHLKNNYCFNLVFGNKAEAESHTQYHVLQTLKGLHVPQ